MVIEIIINKKDKVELKKLKEILLAKNLSIPQAGKICRLSSKTIYRWIEKNSYNRIAVMKAVKKLQKIKKSKL